MNPADSHHDDTKILELLAGKALGDLSVEEQQVLNSVGQEEAWQDDLWELERTAAAVQLALAPAQAEELPQGLKDRLQEDARQFLSQQSSAATLLPPTSVTSTSGRGANRSMSTREWLAWACCAAAILVSVALWQSGQQSSPGAAEARLALLNSADDVVRLEWAPGTTPFEQAVAGDVVWSNAQQAGFMTFRGMPVNDPTLEQYQLWIIDPARDEEPVDGGVFDVSASGEVVVPIHAKLQVVNPQAFAITIEKPGGVVVSTQERLPLLAAVP